MGVAKGIILSRGRLANTFTTCCSNILFVLPASKRNIFLKLIVASFLFENISWKRKWILLISSKLRAYSSVLKSGDFFVSTHPLPKQGLHCGQKELLLIFDSFIYYPTLWRSQSLLFWDRKGRCGTVASSEDQISGQPNG